MDAVPGYKHIKLKYGPYSASKLLMAKCPSRFESKFIHKDVVVGDSVAAAKGSAIHSIFEKITAVHIKNKMESTAVYPTAAEVESWVSEAIGKFPAALGHAELIHRSAMKYMAHPNVLLSRATTTEKKVALALYEEETFIDDVAPKRILRLIPYEGEAERGQNPDAFFCVAMDQLSVDEEIKTVTVVDHKTTPNTRYSEEFDFQMGCYAWVASLLYPNYKIRTQIHYCHPELDHYAYPKTWEKDDLQWIRDQIFGQVMAIESYQEYPAVSGSGCDYCHMSNSCTLVRKLREQNERADMNLTINSFDDYKRVAEYLVPLKKLTEMVNDKLKDAASIYAPLGVSLPGVFIGDKVSEKVDWADSEDKLKVELERADAVIADPTVEEAVKEKYRQLKEVKNLSGLMEANGIDPDAYRAWKGDKLKMLYKADRPKMMEFLNYFLVKEKSTRFGTSKN